MKAKYFVNKAKRLEQRLHNIQSEIYNFSSELEDAGLNTASTQASESGFELDVSHSKMNDIWVEIEATFCNKVTKS